MKSTVGNKKESSWWKGLSKICDDANEENWFDKNINWVVGDGQSIRLWEDIWNGVNHLKIGFQDYIC